MTRLTDPNSAVTRLRGWLARRLEPRPAPGEAWCMTCELNGGRTLIVTADGWRAHVERHSDLPGTHYVDVKASYPPEQED